MTPLSPELTAAALTTVFTGVMWIPIILNRIREMKLWPALRNPQPDVRPDAEWAYRLMNAHRNAIENLIVFVPLAVIVHITGAGDTLTATAGTLFVVMRIAHAFIYTLGIPLLRTIAFFAGFLVQMLFALRIFGLV